VNAFVPGLRELARKSRRLLIRLRLAAARRTLEASEAELGLLGWQQADYDPDTQRQVDKIQNYEREQSRLTNAGAELGRAIRECQAKREAAHREYEESRRALLAQRDAVAEPVAGSERQLLALRKQEPEYERRIPELDRELREVTAAYEELLSSPTDTPESRADLVRLRERTVAVPNEKADLRTQHLRVVSEIKALETTLLQSQHKTAALNEELRALEAAYTIRDREAAAEIRQHEGEKAEIDKAIDELEEAKTNPYLQIGRVLADHNLGPMNQPHVLEKVRGHRHVVQAFEYELAKSLHESTQDDPKAVVVSYFLWAASAGTAALIGAVLLSM